MEAYSPTMQQDLVAQLARVSDHELKLLLRYYHTRQGPGQQLVEAEAEKRHILIPLPNDSPSQLSRLHGQLPRGQL